MLHEGAVDANEGHGGLSADEFAVFDGDLAGFKGRVGGAEEREAGASTHVHAATAGVFKPASPDDDVMAAAFGLNAIGGVAGGIKKSAVRDDAIVAAHPCRLPSRRFPSG